MIDRELTRKHVFLRRPIPPLRLTRHALHRLLSPALSIDMQLWTPEAINDNRLEIVWRCVKAAIAKNDVAATAVATAAAPEHVACNQLEQRHEGAVDSYIGGKLNTTTKGRRHACV